MPRLSLAFAYLLKVVTLALTIALFSNVCEAQSEKKNTHKIINKKLANTKKVPSRKHTKSKFEIVEEVTKPELVSEPEKSVTIDSKVIKTKTATKLISQKLWQGITVSDLEYLKKISLALKNDNYEAALSYTDDLNTKETAESEVDDNDIIKSKPGFAYEVKDIVLWNKYSGKINPKNISFSDISRFVNDNPFFPNISEIKRNVERVAVANKIPYKSGEQYFRKNPADTTESKIYFLQSKIAYLERFEGSAENKFALQKEISDLISAIWIKANFSEEEEKSFLSKYQNQLTVSDHIARVDRLLWDNKIFDAKRIIPLVDEDHQKLFSAIIELQDSPKYIDNLVLSVPRRLRSNEGLSYRRVLWYKSRDKTNDLLDLMTELPSKLQYPEKWWGIRRLYAREMLKTKNYKVSYLLVANHSLPTSASDFWEAEWMSGWIALRFLDRPKEAYQHFDNLYKNVNQPVTLSRATYWLAMASHAMGKKDQAIYWYKTAAKYPLFFYGQLAINKHRALDSLNAQYDIILPKDPDILVSDMKAISASKVVKIAYLLALTGDKKNATKIFDYAVENAATDGQIAVIMKIINELDDRQLDARISRTAAKHNVFFIKDKFQIVKEVPNNEYAPLIHAIVKQESGFAQSAVSQVGALGFMQLMPTTAKLVAKDIGVDYNKNKLATDTSYNVRLGTHYIKKLIDRFDGSEILAIASYNAGPNATQRWINEFYDPRKEKDLDKVVDWIELISYAETRNYVQRIMENLIVYKYIMSRANYDNVQ